MSQGDTLGQPCPPGGCSGEGQHPFHTYTLENYIERASIRAQPKYEAACRAVAEAKSVDEAKSIRDEAQRMAA